MSLTLVCLLLLGATPSHAGVDDARPGIFRITPLRPVAELRREALAARPPTEPGPFRPVELVELVTLDATIRLDIRYATSDDFLGAPVYAAGSRLPAAARGRGGRCARTARCGPRASAC